jgi:hypothetical protein
MGGLGMHASRMNFLGACMQAVQACLHVEEILKLLAVV